MSVPGFGTEEDMFSGYTVGAGVDYPLTGNIFARVEYRHSDFGNKTCDFGSAVGLQRCDLRRYGSK